MSKIYPHYICEDGVRAFIGDRVMVHMSDNVSVSGTIKDLYIHDIDIVLLPDTAKQSDERYACEAKNIECVMLLRRGYHNTSLAQTDKEPDMVSHPPHYQSPTGLEVIDVIKAFTSDLVGIEATDTGNILKYMCRWKHKNGKQDLEKARWYLNHLINCIEEKENESNN